MPLPPLPEEDLQHVLHHTAPLWEEARGKSFFITGGTGFFGAWLLESFLKINEALDLNARVMVLSRDPQRFLEKLPHLAGRAGLEFLAGDIRNFTFPSGNFDYVVHAATEVSARPSGASRHLFDSLVEGTRHLLDFTAQAGTQKLLLTSSGAAYGTQPAALTHLPENHYGAPDPTCDGSAYGEGKRVAEYLSCVHAREFNYQIKIARCFAFAGPHLPLDSGFAIGNFIRDSLGGHPIHISGDGSPMRSYLYASDLAIWLWTLLFRAPSHRIYNVGSGDDISISDLAVLVRDSLKSSSDVEIHGIRNPSSPVSRYVPSVDRAFQELGLQPTISLQEAILKTARWHQAEPPPPSDS